jgi:Tfp pilus assembly ATPase PilU
MYHMDHLLTLLTLEKAKELRFAAGKPPLMVSEDEERLLEGPALTAEDVRRLLRCVAGSREMRELRQSGAVSFLHTPTAGPAVLVRAHLEQEDLVFDIS